jgi:hypothetical protein
MCVLLLGFPYALSGQVSTGTINVEVQDPTNAVIPGATVKVVHTATGQERSGPTSETGQFRASFVPTGEYIITATASGFKQRTITGLVLRVDQNATIIAALEPGEVREVVRVSEATPLLETSTSSVGQVVDNKKIVDLPLNGRNPFALGLLAGNTTPLFGMGSNLAFVGGGGRFSSNEVLLDGVDNNTTVNQGAIGRAGVSYTPSVDAVQEFKVQTNNFSAEFGQSAGTVINATIRSGSNDFHGALFEFLRNDKLDANNFFSNAARQQKAMFRQNQFGGAGGGRILRNRTFFFIDYEGTRRRTAAGTSILDVPIGEFRSGDFAKYNAPVYDPRARRIGPQGTVVSDPLPNNRIPASQINSTAAAITSLVPLPNFGAGDAQTRNFFRQVPRRFNHDRWDARLDHRISTNNNVFGRFSFGNQVQPTPGRFDGFIGGGVRSVDFTRHLVLNDTHIFTPTMVNEFRFGYSRHNGSIVGDAASGAGFADQNRLSLFPFPVRGFPVINFFFSGLEQGAAQFTSWGGGNSNLNFENRFQWSDNLNITHGGHTFKVGTDIRRYRIETLKGTPFFGQYIFGSIFSSSSDRSGSGAPFADFLMGFPSAISGTQMLDWGREREIYWGTYFQDDWKVSRQLTLNLGIRYDLFTQPVDARDRGALFNARVGRFQVPGKDGFSRAIVDGDHNNIAPRFGFAYQWTPKIVIRGGYGMFYGMRDRNQETTQFSGNPPNTPQFGLPASTALQTVTPPYTINTPIVASPSDPLLSTFTAERPFQANFRTTDFKRSKFPVLHQFNVSVQFEPVRDWLLDVTLTGARGRDLASGWFNRNQLPFEAAVEGRNTQRNRPYPNINGWAIESASIGSSHYHSANFRLEKRHSSGLSFLLNYTVSKNIENMGSGVCNFSQYASTIMLDAFHPEREKTVAPLDVPQVFVVSYGYELPWGPGRPWLNNGVASRVLGGWQINGITTLRGGFPSDILTNVQPPNFSNFNVPDRVAGQSRFLPDRKVPDRYLNPAAFRVPGTVPNNVGAPIQRYGDSARGVIRGPGSVNLDFSVFKEARFTERHRLQFRAEFFNLTNTPTFFLSSPSSSALTCRGVAGGPCTNTDFGTLGSGTATGRQVQFGLKFLF